MEINLKVCRCVVPKHDSHNTGQDCIIVPRIPATATSTTEYGPGHEGNSNRRAKGLHNQPDRERPDRERPPCCLPPLSPPHNTNTSGRERPVHSKGNTRRGVASHVYSSQRWIRSRGGQRTRDKHERRKSRASRKHLEVAETGKSSTIVAVPTLSSSRVNSIDVATQEDGTSWSGSCYTDGSEIRCGSSAASFRSSEGSRGSVNTMNTVGTPTDCVGEAFPLQQVVSGTEVEGGGNGVFAGADTQMKGLSMVERTVFESWKGLPWQARLCPRAIEEQENARRALALKKESHRVQVWRQEQQVRASSAAHEEEQKLVAWWKGEARKLWKSEAQQKRTHAQLATHQDAQLAKDENQRTDLLSAGYGRELAALDKMDLSEHAERQKHTQTLFAAVVSTILTEPGENHDESGSGSGLATVHTLVDATRARGGRGEVGGRPAAKEQEACMAARLAAQTEAEIERVARHASTVLASAHLSCRRRQSFSYLVYKGLAVVYGDVRSKARRAFVSECAAGVARVKELVRSFNGRDTISICRGGANSTCGSSAGEVDDDVLAGGDVGPDAAWNRERRRVKDEIEQEASRVTRWTRLQRGVLLRSTGEVLRLLTVDSLRQAPVDEGGRWLGICTQGGGSGGGARGAESIEAVRKRARGALAELRTRQAAARLEADSVERSWMAALTRWKDQLQRARVTAAKREIGELHIRQREDAEAMARKEDAVIVSLSRRGEAIADSWGGVFELERGRIDDALGSWRHCFVAACDKLNDLIEDTRRARLRVANFWKDKTATAMSRSRVLSGIVDLEQVRLEDERTVLVVDLANIVSDISATEAQAATDARREWWREFRDTVLNLFPRGSAKDAAAFINTGSSKAEGSGRRETAEVAGIDTNAGTADINSEVASPSTASVILLDCLEDMIRTEELRAADAWGGVLSEDGPLHHAVAKKQQGNIDAIEACADAFEVACEKRPSDEDKIAVGQASKLTLAEGLDQFRLRVEREAVQIVSSSFEDEVRRLAGEFEERTETVTIEEASVSPEEECPSELTRSQLDLRRAARVRAYVRAAGEMLTQAHEALQEYSVEATATNEEEHNCNVSKTEALHLERLDDLRHRARADGEGALKAALAQVRSRVEDISTKTQAATKIRRHAIKSAVDWVDQTIRTELEKSEQRLHEMRDLGVTWQASLEDLTATFSSGQQGLARRIQESVQDTVDEARIVVADAVAERARLLRERTAGRGMETLQDDKKTGKINSSRASNRMGGAAIAPGALLPANAARREHPGKNSKTLLQVDKTRPGSYGVNVGSIANRVTAGSEDVNSQKNNHLATPSPYLDDLEADVFGLLATAEAYLADGVEAWVEEARSQAFSWAKALISDAEAAESAVRHAAEIEEKDFQEKFQAANEEARRVLFAPLGLETTPPPEHDFPEGAERGGGQQRESPENNNTPGAASGCRGSSGHVQPLSPNIEEEQREFGRFWSDLEQMLKAHRRTSPVKQAGSTLREKADRLGGRAMAAHDGLEPELRSILAETTARGTADIKATLRAGTEELRGVSVPTQEETRGTASGHSDRGAGDSYSGV